MAGEGGEQARIAIFLRLRPVERPSSRVVTNAEEAWVDFNVPKDATAGPINNSRESYRFPFDGLLPPDAQQGEVFDRVALPVLRSALDGYNGTVFAFGQTGSGKTFTITGGTERYADRGLIPRAISALFAEAASRTDHTYTVHVSYMEIYNETGFDLLEPSREVQALEDLPKVHIMEDESSRMHIRNLSMHRCDTEEQALNMLFLGDTNRVVAETPLNQASSRSHCVFTLHVEARRAGEAVVRRSKLNFVDLAGSERVGKTGLAAHAQLKEAKYINLSLHFLEQVIISLQEGRPHIPYRNSVLTMVLRDSLGGNTRTVMVAAVSPEAQHIEESISTCRFAQRVAMISNRVEVNEEEDVELVVQRLKQENMLLRQELQLLRSNGGSSSGDAADGSEGSSGGGSGSGGIEQRQVLSEGQQHMLRRQVQAFVEDPSPVACLNVEASMLYIHAAFGMLKSMVRAGGAGQQGSAAQGDAAGSTETAAELRSLRLLVQQQEQQIGVLAGVLRKQELGQGQAGGFGPSQRGNASSSSSTGSLDGSPRSSHSSHGAWPPGSEGPQKQVEESGRKQDAATPARLMQPIVPYSDALLADKNKAFQYFCSTSPAHDAVAEHKAVLRGKYEDARTLGSQVSACKQRIGQLKSAVEQRRLARSMAVLLQRQRTGRSGGMEEGEEQRLVPLEEAEEQHAKGLIEQEKVAYREAYTRLKGVKAEIDGVQALLERSRVRLQHDFHAWFAAMTASSHSGRHSSNSSSSSGEAVPPRSISSQGGAKAGSRHEPAALALSPEQAGAQLPGSSAGVGSDPVPQQSWQQQSLPKQSRQEQTQQQVQGQDWLIPAATPTATAPGSRPSSSRSSHTVRGSSFAPQSHASFSMGPGNIAGQLQPGQVPTGSRKPASQLASSPEQQAQATLASSVGSFKAGLQLKDPAVLSSPMSGSPILPRQPSSQQVWPAQLEQKEQQADSSSEPYAGVDPEVLAAARPLLTGNPQADGDIIKFYQARAALLKGMRSE